MKRIVIHCQQETAKMALLEDGKLVEYVMEQPERKQLVGNIYRAKVVNILPGMQAAFVDIGLDKNAFLYRDDLLHPHLEKQPKVKPSIKDLLKEGQDLVVQVAKEPIGTKGAKVTTHIAIPGRWLVYMPLAEYIGVSRKIESEEERERLKALGEKLRQEKEGLIIRTVAEGESAEAIESDVDFLRSLWNSIHRKVRHARVPSELYRELNMIPRLIRDMFTDDIEECVIDDVDKGQEIHRYLKDLSPDYAGRVSFYHGKEPILEHFGIQDELSKAFRPKIWLRSGGYLVVDETEALTVIDVNTGKYTGTVDLEETVFRTNLEAAEEIARLLRLRDMGGIIIIDFIDMKMSEHRAKIVETMEQIMKRDRTKNSIVGWTRLGLLEITRKKIRENMDKLFYESCPHCQGKGKQYTKHHPLY